MYFSKYPFNLVSVGHPRSFLSPRNIVIGANSGQKAVNVPYIEKTIKTSPRAKSGQKRPFYELLGSFTDAEIANMVKNTKNPIILRKLIGCESEDQNVARTDSNGIVSWGLFQFNGTATWDAFAPKAGVASSVSPMNPMQAIR